jgi:hypothetical protein
MYYRLPSKDSDIRSPEKPLDQTETGSFEIISELACKDESPELASDDELNLSTFSESDLAQLTNCLDWLIDSSGDKLIENKPAVSSACQDTEAFEFDIESSGLSDDIDSLVQFTDDNFISTSYSDCSIDKSNPHNSTLVSNFEKTSVDSLLNVKKLDSMQKCDRMKDVVEQKKLNENDSTFDTASLVNCSSPSSSSGCESDFSSSTFEDDPFSFSTDIGLMDLSDEPFTELFPALY